MIARMLAAAYLAVNRSLLKAIFQIRCEENLIDTQPVDSLNLQSEAIRAGSSHRCDNKTRLSIGNFLHKPTFFDLT
jgi:hypothetical protein